jgi:RNA-directed DNA polymerase
MKSRNGDGAKELYCSILLIDQPEMEAKELRTAIGERLGQCKLELHLEKTKIIYCKDDKQRGSYSDEKFDFLGFTFRSRRAKSRWGKYFISFSPAISHEATKSIQEMVRS